MAGDGWKKFPETPPPDHPSLPAQDTVKVCQRSSGGCGQELPKSPDYFDRDNSRPDGLKSICKSCRAEQRKKREDEALAEKLKSLERTALLTMEQMVSKGSSVPHMAEVFQRLMESFNGVDGFAQHYMAQYLSAQPGSAIRQKMLDTMIRLNQKVSESGAAQKSLEDLTDEDLERIHKERLLRLVGIEGEEGGERAQAS